jgi:hypothetical protein
MGFASTGVSTIAKNCAYLPETLACLGELAKPFGVLVAPFFLKFHE